MNENGASEYWIKFLNDKSTANRDIWEWMEEVDISVTQRLNSSFRNTYVGVLLNDEQRLLLELKYGHRVNLLHITESNTYDYILDLDELMKIYRLEDEDQW